MRARNQHEYRNSFRLVSASVGVFLCLVASLIAYLLNESYHRYYANAEQTAQNLSLSLETFLEAHFQSMDLALQSAALEFQAAHRDARFRDADFSAFVGTLRQRMPNAAAVRGANAAGWVIYGPGSEPTHPLSVLQREFFQQARDRRSLVFGLPLVSRVTGEQVLPVARPLLQPDGSFGGAVYVNTTVARLLELFSSIKIGEHGAIAIFDTQRRLLVRFPEVRASASGQVPMVRSPEAIAVMESGRTSATFATRSSIDGFRRTVALRRIGSYPVYVQVGLAQADYMRHWRDEVITGILFLLLLSAAAFMFCRSLGRNWRREVRLREAEATRLAHDHLAAVVAAIPDSLFLMDAKGNFLESTAEGMNLTCLVPGGAPVSGRNANEVLPADAAQVVMAALAEAAENGSAYGHQLLLHGPAGERWMELSVSRKEDAQGGGPTLIVLARDVTERKQAQAQIEQLAFSDLLTKLPNRRLFLDRLRQSMASSERSGKVGALLFLDLDQFKTVNDSMGHQFGDLLLIQTAQRLRHVVRQGDTVARMGGDEFVVILEQLAPNTEDAASVAMTIAQKIVDELDAEYDLHGREYRSTVSIGVTLFHGYEVAMDELLRRADTSMYQAKSAGRNAVRFFDPKTQAAIEARLAMEQDLQRAVAEQEFLLHYQPQIDQAGRCVGVEALIRWHNKVRGLVPPGDFIPIAEETGLISPIGHWVMMKACELLKRWADIPLLSHVTVAVNVSARQFAHPNFAREVRELVEHYEIDPTRLKLELTESMLIAKVEEVIERMSELRAIGISFSLDDFGTGFSSLSYLKRLPFSQVKIDRSFALDVLVDSNDAAICHAIIALGSTLGLEVIAEGIETQEQWDFLKAAGCSHAQGYMIGRPMPAEDFERWAERAVS